MWRWQLSEQSGELSDGPTHLFTLISTENTANTHCNKDWLHFLETNLTLKRSSSLFLLRHFSAVAQVWSDFRTSLNPPPWTLDLRFYLQMGKSQQRSPCLYTGPWTPQSVNRTGPWTPHLVTCLWKSVSCLWVTVTAPPDVSFGKPFSAFSSQRQNI